MNEDLEIAPGVLVAAEELVWTAVRAGGPGGQNVNKVSTKVELRFDLVANRSLGEAVKARLRAANGGRLDARGRLLVTCDTTRSQSQNLEIARNKLRELVQAAMVVPKRRRPTRPSRGQKQARLDDKRLRSEKKRGRARDWD